MLETVCVTSFLEEQYDIIIDARSPAEFAHSHILGAVNLWALDDAQHKEIGTHYKQISKNEAKIMGASYICANAAQHIKTLAALQKIGAKVGIYCARGGLRSTALGVIFAGIGYRVQKLEGGYKAFRGVVTQFFNTPLPLRFIVLGGSTGCGKTQLIERLGCAIDLEAMANHLGSVFGAICGKQPSQKAFEDSLFFALRSLPACGVVFIEGESRRIGRLFIPLSLWQGMVKGVRIEIKAPLEQRIARIVQTYNKVDGAFFHDAMEHLSPYIKKTTKEAIVLAYTQNHLHEAVRLLLVEYYDRVYKKPLQVALEVEHVCEQETLAHLERLALSWSKQ